MLALKLVLFGLSSLGAWELLRLICKDRIDIHFLPSLAIAIQVTVLFFAGLLNILPEAAVALYIAGFTGLILSIYQCRGLSFIKNYFSVGYMVLLITISIMSLYVHGKTFVHYDNFSHWALVVKTMLLNDRYPTFKDIIIVFQEYPLGSSTYVYFFAKLTSRSEPIQMLAQVYMLIAGILPIFAFAKKNKIAIAVMAISFINFIFVYNIRPTDLLVDTLLPVTGICGLLLAYMYCNTNSTKLELWLTSFYMVQLVQIKNSGIFFAVIIVILLLKRMPLHKQYPHTILCVLFSFFTVMLWHKHCRYVFQSAESSYHALTYEQLNHIFKSKSADDIRSICIALFKFAATYKDIWVILGFFVMTGILLWLINRAKFKPFLNIVIFSLIIYTGYQIGMAGMYVFSMGLNESLRLAGVVRYTKTILIAIMYLYMVCLVQFISDINTYRFRSSLLVVYSFLSFFVYTYISNGEIDISILYTPDSSTRRWVETIKSIYNIPDDNSYCTLISSSDSGYIYYLTRYVFYSTHTSSLIVDIADDMDSIDTDYILVYDQENEVINTWIRENYPEQYGNCAIVNWKKQN